MRLRSPDPSLLLDRLPGLARAASMLALAFVVGGGGCKASEGEVCRCASDCQDGFVCIIGASTVLAPGECAPDLELGYCAQDDSIAGEESGLGEPPVYDDMWTKRDFASDPTTGETGGDGDGDTAGDGDGDGDTAGDGDGDTAGDGDGDTAGDGDGDTAGDGDGDVTGDGDGDVTGDGDGDVTGDGDGDMTGDGDGDVTGDGDGDATGDGDGDLTGDGDGDP